ncbi:epoxyqueuosine reductase QueH [bacterium]|nr:epoxyqueuosine reductase QueH [bacterium]
MEKVLLHICCAPCACYPVAEMLKSGLSVTGFWYNPNIHPYLEYKARKESLEFYANKLGLDVIYDDDYGLVDFLRAVASQPEFQVRCRYCYRERLERAAQTSSRNGFEAFTTTLLYSIYQDHEFLMEIGHKLADKYGVRFYYQDFRRGWLEGQKLSRAYNLYHQKYCGCIYSEKERYLDKLKVKPFKYNSTG